MSVTEWWWLGLGVFAAVTVVVAVLLGLIIATARRIEHNAAGIWTVGKQIAGNTVSIWILDRVKRILEEMDEHVRRIGRVTTARRPGDGKDGGQ